MQAHFHGVRYETHDCYCSMDWNHWLQCLEASNGQEAVEIGGREHPDLILLISTADTRGLPPSAHTPQPDSGRSIVRDAYRVYTP